MAFLLEEPLSLETAGKQSSIVPMLIISLPIFVLNIQLELNGRRMNAPSLWTRKYLVIVMPQLIRFIISKYASQIPVHVKVEEIVNVSVVQWPPMHINADKPDSLSIGDGQIFVQSCVNFITMIQSLVNGNIFRVVIHAQLAAAKNPLDMKIVILDVLKVTVF